MAMDVLVGPDRWMTPAWRADLPPSRHQDLADFRIGGWFDDPHCRVDADTKSALERLAVAIEDAGGRVDTEARPAFTLEKVDGVFFRLLHAALSGGHERSKIEHMAGDTGESALSDVKRATAVRHRDWLSDNERRLQIRERWAEFFGTYDAILLPVQPRAAIPHDHSEPQFGRSVSIGGVERPYTDLFQWTGPAGVGMLPATVVPVGRDTDGLPIGVQIVGPFLEDRTTLRLAALITDIVGGWPRPSMAD